MTDKQSGLRISDLKEDDRPREKALASGIGALSDAELLAIAIGSGLPGRSAISVARTMLSAAGGKLTELRSQSIHSLIRNNPGIGPARAVAIAAAFELGARCHYEHDSSEPPVVTDARVVYNYIRRELETLPHEEFWCLTLSRANRITSRFRVSSGGLSATVVDVTLLMKAVVDRLAAAIILVHNHPSGNLNPSAEDIRLTQRIKGACDLFGIRLLDHLIVTAAGFFSFTNEGRL